MGDRLKVIYVDDEPDIRTIVEMALGLDPDLEVRIAEAGREALEMVAGEWQPDLALLDVMMPQMSGKELMQHLRKVPGLGDLPIIFITASARQAELEHYLREGGDGVIVKPFDPLTLAGRVRSVYERIIAARGA